MYINFDKPVHYEQSDYETFYVFSPEESTAIVNKYLRTEFWKFTDLQMLFSNHGDGRIGENNYQYERTQCNIQRFIDKHIEALKQGAKA